MSEFHTYTTCFVFLCSALSSMDMQHQPQIWGYMARATTRGASSWSWWDYIQCICLNTTVLWHSWAIGVIDSQCASLEPLCEHYRIWKSARDWQMDIKIHEMTNSNKTSVKFVESLDVRIKNRIGRFVGCVKRHHRFWISLNSQREVMKSIEGFLSRYCDYRLWSFCGGWVRDMHEVLLLVCLV